MASDNKKIYKFQREDFGPLKVDVLHLDLDFDVYDEHTRAVSRLKLKNKDETLEELELNAKKLELLAVGCKEKDINHEYDEKNSKLIIIFEEPVKPEEEITIITETICRPTKNLLEGLYYDETPEGAPPTQITQCQQWGFQRIVPCMDRMTAKCTYNTTITADERYTHIISNGDPIGEREKVGDCRVKVKYDNTTTPMAPYLFFLGVGTYDEYNREFEYPDGKTFKLELLTPKDADKEAAEKALDVLYHSIMWIHLFTGPDRVENEEKSNEIWKLVEKRERLKAEGEDLSEIRKQLKELSSRLKLGYKYTGTVYREIGMQNSDFGGMENVGNTTISTNRMMPFPDMTDGAFEYMVSVKCHEFYHNINGSEVTGQSPFEIWLNEAVTVHIENKHHEFTFGKDYSRLKNVITLLSPDRGTFVQDDSAASMPIEPDGFNDPNELITSITYVKSPEFVKMIETLMSEEKFMKGLDTYYSRYKHGNATREQWLGCMEEVAAMDFKEMAEDWLKKTGFPKVKAATRYDADSGIATIDLEQLNAEDSCWQFPLKVALLDEQGSVLAEKTEWIQEEAQTIIFENVSEKPLFSLNRDCSFYGKLYFDQSEEELYQQVRVDNNNVNRFMAYYKLMDREKMRLLKDKDAAVNDRIIDLYFELLSDEELTDRMGVLMNTLFESVEDEKYAHKYQELYDVKKRIMRAVAERYEVQLRKLYEVYSGKKTHGPYLDSKAEEIKDRQIKNLALSLLAKLDKQEIHEMIKSQFENSESASDKVQAFDLYLNSSAADKLELLDAYEGEAKENLVRWETFLIVVARNDSKDYLDIIRRVEASEAFRIEQANDQRALYGVFAANRKKSLQTAKGREFYKEKMLELARINEYSTVNMLKNLGNVDKMDQEYHAPLVKILVDLLEELDSEETPSVYNTAKRMLKNLPEARSNYEEKYGEIEVLRE